MEIMVVAVKVKRHLLQKEIIIEALEIDTISKDTLPSPPLPSPPKRVVREVKALLLTLADDLTQHQKTRAPLTTSLLVVAEYYRVFVTG